MKVNKAAGPDTITGNIIKTCHLQLCSAFHVLVQLCVELGEIPLQWKTAEIVPIPKKPNPLLLNDYRPITLTSLLMKSFERIVPKYMSPQVEHLLDPLQFAYVTKRSVGNATLSMLNVILEHLERRGSYAGILFVDFSSEFNTIQRHLMIRKLIDLGVGKHFVMLVHSFLTNRLHYVNVSVVCVRNMCLSPPELLRGVYCSHVCIPCTLIHAEGHTQTITTSSMQTTLLLSVCCLTTKLTTDVT